MHIDFRVKIGVIELFHGIRAIIQPSYAADIVSNLELELVYYEAAVVYVRRNKSLLSVLEIR